jgi:hypothetical protein
MVESRLYSTQKTLTTQWKTFFFRLTLRVRGKVSPKKLGTKSKVRMKRVDRRKRGNQTSFLTLVLVLSGIAFNHLPPQFWIYLRSMCLQCLFIFLTKSKSLCQNKSWKNSELILTQFHWMVPSFAHFPAALKLGMKQGLQGQTRGPRQDDFEDNSIGIKKAFRYPHQTALSWDKL